ncbi:MAG TPA: hypothetical protein VF599_24155 [Pyrinomonadaceae bacterium]|jgi:hypothetical protein
MIALDDEIWNKLLGGYQDAYNPVECLTRLYKDADDDEAWKELWEELHHQGDIGQASYAAVPHILEIERRARRFNWNGFALLAVIEQRRPSNDAPGAGEIADGYKKAWDELLEVVASQPQKNWDDNLTTSILSCIAYARGQRAIACAALEMNERVARDFLKWHQELEDDDDLDEFINGG